MYFVLKKLQLMICKNWRVRFWPVTWELTLGFDRLKTTPDRSSLGAGCTTTLMQAGQHRDQKLHILIEIYIVIGLLFQA